MPSLADGFSARPETAPALRAALVPGTAVALVPGRVAADGARDWLGSSGKTQLAVAFAEWLWQSRQVELLVWAVATSRGAVLSAFAEAAVAAMGTDPSGDAEVAAARFTGWLGETSRPWLVVLDDLADPAYLDGVWPEGPGGRVLITTSNSAIIPREHRTLICPVGVFSSREALSFLMGRLTADPDQRLGAIDLVDDLGCEPLALAQASGVIASSALSYGITAATSSAAGISPPAVRRPPRRLTWTFSVEQAERLQWTLPSRPAGFVGQRPLACSDVIESFGLRSADGRIPSLLVSAD